MSSPAPDKSTLLPPDEMQEEAQLFARKLISDHRRAQKLTYKMLARRLEAYGIQDSAAVLNTKVFRGVFPAAFLNHPGNRGGCLVKVKLPRQRALRVLDNTVVQPQPVECPRWIPAAADD